MLPPAAVAVRDGVKATVGRCVRAREEAEAATRWLVERHAAGTPWRDVLLIAPGKRKWSERLAKALDAASVPYRMLLGDPGAMPDPDLEVVHVTSLHGAAGLARPAVAIVGLGDLPWKRQPLDEAVRVVHACMRVATERLAVSHSRPSALVAAMYPGDYNGPMGSV